MRHGAFDGLGRCLSGRMPGVGLNADGRAQARRLAEHLTGRAVAAIYSSPLQRALETATILAQRVSLPIQSEPDLREVDFGDWTGQRIEDLTGDEWEAFNRHRVTARIPGGELMLEVQARAVSCLVRLAARHGDKTVVAVSHADVIRAVLTGCLGCGLDAMLRLSVDPASITELCIGQHAPLVVRVNDTAHLVASPAFGVGSTR